MSRQILSEDKIHPAIRDAVSTSQAAIVAEVQAAVAAHPVVVVGMGVNPFPKKATKALTAHGTAFHHLSYGSYFSEWRPRTALKMWTGWPTFPMIFVRGTLIGGFTELEGLIASGELDRLLAG